MYIKYYILKSIRGSDSSILTWIRLTFTAKNNWENWIKYELPQKNLLENTGEPSRMQGTKTLKKGNKEISQIFISGFPFKAFADFFFF